MIYEHTEIHVLPGQGARLQSEFAASRSLLLQAHGCLFAEMLASIDHPDTYLLRVGWEKLADHTEAFSGTPLAKKLAESFAPHCVGVPRVVHYAETTAPETISAANQFA